MITKKEQKIQSKLEAHLAVLRESLTNAEACRTEWYDNNSGIYNDDGSMPMRYVMELIDRSNRVHRLDGQIRLIEDVLQIRGRIPQGTSIIWSNKQESYV
jgi:hypothetical protein